MNMFFARKCATSCWMGFTAIKDRSPYSHSRCLMPKVCDPV